MLTVDVKQQCNNATSQDRKSPMQQRPGSKPGFRCQAIVRQLYSLSFTQDLASSQCCSERLLLYRYTVSNAPKTWLQPRIMSDICRVFHAPVCRRRFLCQRFAAFFMDQRSGFLVRLLRKKVICGYTSCTFQVFVKHYE